MKPIRPTLKGIFPIVKLNKVHTVCLGNGTQVRLALTEDSHYLFVAIEGKGAYSFGGFAYFGYVMEKLNMSNEVDARNVADFIGDQFGASPDTRQGRYDHDLSSDNPKNN